MKRLLLIVLIAFSHATIADGDTYIKTESHTDSYYYMGLVQPAEDSENEVWIGEKRMASITANRITIVDLNNNEMFIINRNDSTYCQTELPLDMSKLVSEQLLAQLQSYKYLGTVKETGKIKKVGEWKCTGYEVNSHVSAEGERYYESDSKIWVCCEIPLDWGVYSDMSTSLHKLLNYDDSYIDELAEIKGYTILVESTTFVSGFGVDWYERVVEISDKNPPYDVYSVPTGFEKKEKLSPQDFRNR